MVQKRHAAMLIGMVLFVGCDSTATGPVTDKTGPVTDKVTSEDVQRDAGQAVDTAVEYTQQAKDEYQKKLAAQLEELDGEIAELRAKGSELKDQAKDKWEQAIADLEQKRDAARVRAAEVGQSSGEAWQEVRKGAESAWEELHKSFQAAKQALTESETGE